MSFNDLRIIFCILYLDWIDLFHNYANWQRWHSNRWYSGQQRRSYILSTKPLRSLNRDRMLLTMSSVSMLKPSYFLPQSMRRTIALTIGFAKEFVEGDLIVDATELQQQVADRLARGTITTWHQGNEVSLWQLRDTSKLSVPCNCLVGDATELQDLLDLLSA